MNQISPYLRRVKTRGGSIGYGHYCPGCNGIHIYWTHTPPPEPNWTFNDNLERPSFSPSMRIYHPAHVDAAGKQQPEKTVCHYFITDGEIRYCPDSAHALKGQNVPLPPLPERYSDDKYGWPGGD